MKKIFLLAAFLIVSCSKEETPDPVTPPAQDATDTWGAWSDWSPGFSNQTADFTQTRTRSVVVNGQADSTPPSGESSESRTIAVTSSEETQTDNERTTSFDNDLNNDGDYVDYVERTITTYTASNDLGSHTVTSDWVISTDQEEAFWNLNYGDWGADISNSEGDYLYTFLLQLRDTLEETRSGQMDTEAGETCFTMETVQEAIDAIPYGDYSIGDDTSTEFDYTLFDIDLGQWTGDSDYDGILVDYEVIWITADQAGNQVIAISERIYIAYSIGGTYSDDDIIASLTGVIVRLDADTEYNVCSDSSKKAPGINKQSNIDYLLNNIDYNKLN